MVPELQKPALMDLLYCWDCDKSLLCYGIKKTGTKCPDKMRILLVDLFKFTHQAEKDAQNDRENSTLV